MAALRIFLRGLFWLLLAYWLTFIGYTIKNLATGGPNAAVIWYSHISGEVFKWDWRMFLFRQMVILAITLAAWFFGKRPSSRKVANSS